MFRRYSGSRLVAGLLIFLLLPIATASSRVKAAPGDIDQSFGTSGVVTTDLTTRPNYAVASAKQSDGKIVAAVYYDSGIARDPAVVIRYNTDGTLDTSFDTDGYVITNLPGSVTASLGAIAVQNDGKIVVAGSSPGLGFLVMRYNSNGTLDTSFDTDGIAIIEVRQPVIDDFARDIAFHPNGDISVIGTATKDIGGGESIEEPGILRLSSTGSVIRRTILTSSISTTITSAALQSDGALVLVGTEHSDFDNLVALRLTDLGTLDSTFSDDGIQRLTINGTLSTSPSVLIRASGKILVAVNKRGTYDDAALIQYNSNGTLDQSFGIMGISTVPLDDTHDNSVDATIDEDGNIYVVANILNLTIEKSVLIRFTSSGAIDTSFGTNGSKIFSFGNSRDRAIGVHLMPNNKVVVIGGRSYMTTNADTGLIQFTTASSVATLSELSLSDGTLNPGFSSGINSYSALVSHTTTSISITPRVANSKATIRVNGTSVTSGAASAAISLAVGVNSIPVVVTAQDGVTQSTYTISITRAAAVVESSTGNGSPTTTSPATTVATKAPLTVKVDKTITAKSILGSKDITLASTSKVVIAVKTSSKKYCSVTGTKVKGVKKGNCTVVVAVTPKATKTVKKPKTTKTTVTIRVV